MGRSSRRRWSRPTGGLQDRDGRFRVFFQQLGRRHITLLARSCLFVLQAVGLAALAAPAVWAEEPVLPAERRIVASWPVSLFEARVAFDGPVDASIAKECVGKTLALIPSDARPDDARGTIRVAAARLLDDRRTLSLTTDPHARDGRYVSNWGWLTPHAGSREPVRLGFDYDLSGAEASWEPGGPNAQPAWVGWWPSGDLGAFEARLAGSAEHARQFADLGKPGRLTQTILGHLPKGPLDLWVEATVPVEVTVNGEAMPASKVEPRSGLATERARLRMESSGEPALISYSWATGPGHDRSPIVTIKCATPDEPKPGRPIGPTLVPWAPFAPPAPAAPQEIPDLTRGDPRQGAIVFVSAEAKCAHCHKVRGEGGSVGPDLSSLANRDRAEVYRDIFDPSARIHPDYVSFTVALKTGRVLVGTVRAEGESSARITDGEAKTTLVPRAEIEDIRPSATSIMPVGLIGAIGPEKLRDLLAFLNSETPPVKAPAAP